MLKFIFVKSLTTRLTLGYLWEHRIVRAPGGPRPFMQLTNLQYDQIMADSKTEVRYIE